MSDAASYLFSFILPFSLTYRILLPVKKILSFPGSLTVRNYQWFVSWSYLAVPLRMLRKKLEATGSFFFFFPFLFPAWNMNQCLEVKQQSCNHEYRNNTLSKEKLGKKRSRIPLNHKKEWNFAIWNNMDGLGGRYTKWNNSGRERQILYDITYVWNIKIKQGSTRSSTLAWKIPWT